MKSECKKLFEEAVRNMQNAIEHHREGRYVLAAYYAQQAAEAAVSRIICGMGGDYLTKGVTNLLHYLSKTINRRLPDQVMALDKHYKPHIMLPRSPFENPEVCDAATSARAIQCADAILRFVQMFMKRK